MTLRSNPPNASDRRSRPNKKARRESVGLSLFRNRDLTRRFQIDRFLAVPVTASRVRPQESITMLDNTKILEAPEVPPPLYRVTGNFLAKSNGKSLQTRLEVALRILCEGETVAIVNATVSQIGAVVPGTKGDDRQAPRNPQLTLYSCRVGEGVQDLVGGRPRRVHPSDRSEAIWAALSQAI